MINRVSIKWNVSSAFLSPKFKHLYLQNFLLWSKSKLSQQSFSYQTRYGAKPVLDHWFRIYS